ncbi:acyl-CoA dehydrogenase [Vibrio sinensis]|uniref:Acyl-CoA dehydrogenase n=1 Tax=Vibrio sinensis TaxID=2302434 RepID=A0A3A6QGD1_9VIBR|nr:acyl-CoA dehydrogenase family protein [Vibrio sinensis]RJX71502.1 acyl-CoA dehydrogenase [Vibrio sinensis]
MNFSYTDEQIMIEQSANDFFSQVCPVSVTRETMGSEQGYDRELWQRICDDMFFHGILIPEQYGGLGLGYVELCIVLEKIGAQLVNSPFHASACMATTALLLAADDTQKTHYFERLLQGEIATLAYTSVNVGTERGWGCDAVEVSFTKQGHQYVLNGTYRYVPYGHHAQWLILAAREQGIEGEQGIRLFVIDADNASISPKHLPTMDQTQNLAHIHLENLILDASNLLASDHHASETLMAAIAAGQIGLAAEQLGGTQAVLDQTVQYTQQRTQFNRTIASFQAVKHQAADMMLKAEASRSAVYYAACIADTALLTAQTQPDQADLQQAASIAKSYCSEAYFFNASTALQLHGGVGFTWEFDVHLYFKRAQSSGVLLGSSAYHHQQLADQLLGQLGRNHLQNNKLGSNKLESHKLESHSLENHSLENNALESSTLKNNTLASQTLKSEEPQQGTTL